MEENTMTQEAQPATWPVLGTLERRVLGVIVEKAKTTPDAYPLSINALVTGCNQKSNRDPILNVSEDEVEETLAELQKKGLVIRVQGYGRVERWRHQVYESLKVDKVELAILAELLLRGGQTEGDLRGRASRMEPLEDLDALRQHLKPMVERGLVVYLTSEGRRGTLLTHGFLSPKELDVARAAAGAALTAAPETPQVTVRQPDPMPPGRLETLETQLGQARAEIQELQQLVAALSTELRALKEALGV